MNFSKDPNYPQDPLQIFQRSFKRLKDPKTGHEKLNQKSQKNPLLIQDPSQILETVKDPSGSDQLFKGSFTDPSKSFKDPKESQTWRINSTKNPKTNPKNNRDPSQILERIPKYPC